MCCGDLTAAELQKNYFMMDVSEKVEPYTLTELTPFNLPQSRFYHMRGGASRKKYSSRECADIMFDEMRSLSWPFSVYSPYRQLINKMITHMQYGNGTPFRDAALDMALRNQLLDDKTEQSSLKAIKSVIERNVGYKNHNALNKLLFC